jgi:alpha-tubulin suppressor-like RCC1 family protein
MSNVNAVSLGSGYTPLLGNIHHVSPIACGWEHTCILRNDGIFKCYGRASTGALGYGGTWDKGDSGTAELGSIYLTKIGSGKKAIDVSCQGNVNCALLEDKTVKCWGDGASGGLGSGDTVDNNGDTTNGETIPVVVGRCTLNQVDP